MSRINEYIWNGASKTGIACINNSKCENLLRIKIDCKLNFDDHIGNIFLWL